MYEKPFVGTPTDYSNKDNWLVLPAETPLPADVIFLYPTANMELEAPLICDVNDPAMVEQAKGYVAQSCQAFEGVGNLFVPLWRQVTGLYVNTLPFEEVDRAQWAEPRTDVFAAMVRSRGIVPPIKSQNPWGTCWSFATMAASETSLLSSLHTTYDAYEQQYGSPIDFSEKHLAWFAASPLPPTASYPKGKYPNDEDQAGEGIHPLEEGPYAPFSAGGQNVVSSSALAAGVGVVDEELFPYQNSDGEVINDGDWSIDEKNRFLQEHPLKNANILVPPASYDAQGNYTYNPAGTESIKSELLNGRGVAIIFKADQSRPKPSEEDIDEAADQVLEEFPDVRRNAVILYMRIMYGYEQIENVPTKKLVRVVEALVRSYGLPADTYDPKSLTREQLVLLVQATSAGYLGQPIEEIEAAAAAGEIEKPNVYLNFTGTDPVICAQYTYEDVDPNHAVTIVGWDDNFSKEHFQADHQPPADGAWIVRNS